MTSELDGPRRLARAVADQIPEKNDAPGRQLIAIAGPPASGKSTVAALLAEDLKRRGRNAGLAAMDGFHLDNSILKHRGLLRRKGAPETFDVEGFINAINRLSGGGDVIIPTFDRALDKAIAGSAFIAADQDIVVVEGNYLAFDEPRWRDLAAYWSFSAFLSVAEETLESRLTARWIAHGLPRDQAHQRAMENDIPNARRIMRARLPVDLVLDE